MQPLEAPSHAGRTLEKWANSGLRTGGCKGGIPARNPVKRSASGNFRPRAGGAPPAEKRADTECDPRLGAGPEPSKA